MQLVEITRAGTRRVVTLEPDDELLYQREAAKLAKVGVSYLRASDCPKVLLPPNRGKRPLVRYRKFAVLTWALSYEVTATETPTAATVREHAHAS